MVGWQIERITERKTNVGNGGRQAIGFGVVGDER